ncbi:MAG: lysine decarboxylase [Rhodobacteraceae bacterium]|nr:lysine decarboxylase [Paracoccaceae bacterium]
MSQRPQKAYQNKAFMDAPAGRPLRIMAEYMEPMNRLHDHNILDMIVFFGSSRAPSPEQVCDIQHELKNGANAERRLHLERKLSLASSYDKTRKLAQLLAGWSQEISQQRGEQGQRFAIVTGGGPGIMEAANRGAHEAGLPSIGMSIALDHEMEPNAYISDGLSFEFHYFFMRKFWLTYLSKAIVVCPGGLGTIDEFFEIITLLQTKKINRAFPILVLGKEHWQDLINFDAMVERGVINREDLDLFTMTDDVDEGFQWLKSQLSGWALDHPGAGMSEEDLSII